MRPNSDGLSQALYSPDKSNFKDQDINVGVSITLCGFTIHVSMPVVVAVHRYAKRMGVCMSARRVILSS